MNNQVESLWWWFVLLKNNLLTKYKVIYYYYIFQFYLYLKDQVFIIDSKCESGKGRCSFNPNVNTVSVMISKWKMKEGGENKRGRERKLRKINLWHGMPFFYNCTDDDSTWVK